MFGLPTVAVPLTSGMTYWLLEEPTHVCCAEHGWERKGANYTRSRWGPTSRAAPPRILRQKLQSAAAIMAEKFNREKEKSEKLKELKSRLNFEGCSGTSRGEVAASNHERKKKFPPWKQHEGSQKQNFKKGGFQNQQRSERKHDRFSLLTKTPKEIFALNKGEFKAPPPMTTPVEKRNHVKFCEFHGEVGHNTYECMHLKNQIEEMLKAGKLSHLIKELKQNNGKEQPKVAKKGETFGKDKALAIVMNGIIGRPGVRKLQAVPSTAHGMLKILVEGGVLTLKSSKLEVNTTEESSVYWSFMEALFLIIILDGFHVVRSFVFRYNGIIRSQELKKIARFINSSQNAKDPVEGGVITLKSSKLVSLECAIGIMKEIHFHDWLSNPVMVKKHDNSWRMCVNFKDLNKACPKDGYSLTKIDWKVESLCGFPFKFFLDSYKGYHKIQMAKEDEEKNRIHHKQRNILLYEMPFGLRNAGATYQRLIDKAFYKQIGRNLEVYVDDLVIKSYMEDEIVRDIEETFKTLREINMKLNPKKCPFGVEEGMFLGYKVNSKGLKVCPDKVDVVLSLPSPKCLKDVQKLNG
ncbi:reverse transcriptase domain-containing protein [Tanacetum coccineum]